jgi:hypothetical protein
MNLFLRPLCRVARSCAALVFALISFAPSPVIGAEGAAAPVESPSRPKIAIGMSAAQVRQLVGEPTRIKKVSRKEGVEPEIWYYETTVKVGAHEEALSTRDVPYVNPKTGIQEIMKEPVYTLVTDYLTETTALVLVDGVLTGSKRYQTRSQGY